MPGPHFRRRAAGRFAVVFIVALEALLATSPFAAEALSVTDVVASATVSPSVFYPNGDGVRDTTTLTYRLATPATITVAIINYKGSASYTYNGDGLRMAKNVAGSSSGYSWNTSGGLATILRDGGIAYVTGAGGLPLEQISGTTVYWYHEDQLGSVRAITDASGVV